jgi:deoxyribodipyrimidine photo-lyase
MDGAMAAALQVVWFKRDLRVQDHAALAQAALRGPVLPLYVVEPGMWAQPDASARHWKFIRECLATLNHDLAALGQPLVIRHGGAVDALDEIRRRHGLAALWSHEETGNGWTYARDKAVAAWARTHGLPWNEVAQHGVRRGLRDRDGWAAAWDRRMAGSVARPPGGLPGLSGIACGTIPTSADLGLADDGCVRRQPGGRREGLDLLASFLAGRGQYYRRQMSNPLTGATGCSRLSPHLAYGTLSMREVAQATWTRMRDLNGGTELDAGIDRDALQASLASFAGRLHWHCHFMQKLESEPAIEFRELHPAMRGLRSDAADPALLAAWASGHTGYPFLDACMRSLEATGWLNFRMRAMVQSFASYNLWLPWRATGLHLARRFTDYEPGIHWPQAQMQSGTTGINTIRIYSVVKQGHDQDPTGAFVRAWVPELAGVPDRHLQEPWAFDGAGTIIGRRYPERIVDLKASTAAAKDRIYGARRASGFSERADDIQEKHGSRKSGIPMRGQRTKKPPPKLKAAAANQLKLDL